MAKSKSKTTKTKKKTKKKKKTTKKKTKSTQTKKTKTAKKTKKKSSAKKKKAKNKSSQPQTMEELLEKTGYKIRGLQRGDEVEGEVTDISKHAVMVDIGAKTEGLVINKEFEIAEDFIDQLEVGQTIKTIVASPENEKGQILLSLKQAAEDYKWDRFEEYLETDKTVQVRGLNVNKGGLIARFMGVRGFVPASQLGRKYMGRPHDLQNQLFKAKIIEVDRSKNRLILSEKQVSEAKALAAKKEALEKIEVGEAYPGKVSGVMPFGIFVHVPVGKKKDLFLEGLVHISEISWERVDNLDKLFKTGDKVKVKVLGIEEDSGKLNLSIKQLTKDPWEKVAEKYPKDKKIKGKVSRLAAFGAFVELEPGIEGLVHISKIPADYRVKVGQPLDVYVESVDLEKRRMSLGLVLKEKPVGYK